MLPQAFHFSIVVSIMISGIAWKPMSDWCEGYHILEPCNLNWMPIANDNYHHAIIECDHLILGSTFAVFSDNLIRIGTFPDYRGPYKSTFGLHPWDYHLTNNRCLQGSLYSIPSIRKVFILDPYCWNSLRIRRFIGFDFPGDPSHSVPRVFFRSSD